MRLQAVVENGVALVERIHVVADLHLQSAFYDDVEFLSVVRVEVDRLILFFFKIGEFHQKGLGELVLKFRSQVRVFHAVLFFDFQAVAFSRDRKAR